MVKRDLVEALAGATKTTKVAAADAVDFILSTMAASLANGERIRIAGFGTFDVVKTKARNGRNPQTGATIKIKARKKVKFRPSKKLV